MNKIFKNIAIGAVATAALTGCQSDFLDTTPSYSFASSNVWQSAILARAAATGVYEGLYNRFCRNYDWRTDGIPFDAYSSVMDIDQNWRTNLFVASGSATPSSGHVDIHWKLYYTIIYRANDVIQNIDQVPDMDDEEKARLKSESKFLRAWAYYHLNVCFHGVPIYLEVVDPQDATLPRSTMDETWDVIIKDLNDVISDPNIPDKYATCNGRATRGAAYAYLGMVYQWKQDWQSAFDAFSKLDGYGYALYSPSNGAPGNDDFFQLFKPANEGCNEMIFTVQCVNTSGMGNPRAVNFGTRVTAGSCWNNYLPNPAYVEMFENAAEETLDW